jgi:photoactive yellow protein
MVFFRNANLQNAFMNLFCNLSFDSPYLLDVIHTMNESQLDGLDFGVIGFDKDCIVHLYNKYESLASGLSRPKVRNQPFFLVVAPCMNNYLVAQKFEDSYNLEVDLDEIIDFVLTFRMRPTRVRLRMLAKKGAALRHVLIERSSK